MSSEHSVRLVPAQEDRGKHSQPILPTKDSHPVDIALRTILTSPYLAAPQPALLPGGEGLGAGGPENGDHLVLQGGALGLRRLALRLQRGHLRRVQGLQRRRLRLHCKRTNGLRIRVAMTGSSLGLGRCNIKL